jgi:glycogen synthase
VAETDTSAGGSGRGRGMRILMLVWTDVAGDARVRREAATLAAAGHAVHVIGRNVPSGFAPPPGVTVSSAGMTSAFRRARAAAGADTAAPGPAAPGHAAAPGAAAPGAAVPGAQTAAEATAAGGPPARKRLSAPLRVARWLLLPEHVRSSLRSWTAAARRDAEGREFDAVHAHDFTTLELGTALAAARGVPLVYDTHEFWFGRPRVGRPTPLRRRRERRVERRAGARAAAVVTVSEGVADLLAERYGWRHVRVVRNSFPLPEGGPGQAPDAPTGLVYAGRVAPYRELETIAAAAPALAPLRVTIMGPADDTYVASFEPGPAAVEPAGTDAEVEARLRGAGLALVTHSNRWVNHRLALPNKLFHAVRAGVPVVATDVPELRRVVTAHGIGTLYRPGDARSLTAAVHEAVERYPELVAAVRRAAPELSWARDAHVLHQVYATLSRGSGSETEERVDTPFG